MQVCDPRHRGIWLTKFAEPKQKAWWRSYVAQNKFSHCMIERRDSLDKLHEEKVKTKSWEFGGLLRKNVYDPDDFEQFILKEDLPKVEWYIK